MARPLANRPGLPVLTLLLGLALAVGVGLWVERAAYARQRAEARVGAALLPAPVVAR